MPKARSWKDGPPAQDYSAALVEMLSSMQQGMQPKKQVASAGDQRMMRSSERPSAGFREQTVPAPIGTSGYKHRGSYPLNPQLAAYAAALADKEYMRADFNAPDAAEIMGLSYTGDPVQNTERFSADDRRGYAGEGGYTSPLSHRPSYFSSRLSDGTGLYDWTNEFGREHFPAPPIGSQFGPYTPFGIEGGPRSFAGQPIAMGTPEGIYHPIRGRDLPTVGDINRARRAAAQLANQAYDRSWAAGPSYGGGY